MSERFFVETPISGSQIALTGDEARHLAAVMRAAVGDKLTVFDGLGQEYLCRIVRIAKATIDCEVLEARQPQREAAVRLTLAVALPKGDRQKYLVEKLTELGVARLLPLLTERGVAEPVDNALIRLRRGVIEASKQCRRNQLMEILAPQQSKAFFAQTPTLALRILAHPGGRRFATQPQPLLRGSMAHQAKSFVRLAQRGDSQLKRSPLQRPPGGEWFRLVRVSCGWKLPPSPAPRCCSWNSPLFPVGIAIGGKFAARSRHIGCEASFTAWKIHAERMTSSPIRQKTECAHFWTTDGFLGSQERKLPPLLESESAVSRSQLLAAVGLIALGLAAAWPFRRHPSQRAAAVQELTKAPTAPVTLEVSPLAATSPAEESETQFRLLRSRVERPRPPQPQPAELETLPAPPTFPASFRSELEPVLPHLRDPQDLPAWKPQESPKRPARKSRGRRHPGDRRRQLSSPRQRIFGRRKTRLENL
jgi:16S rRNA (uracil1498-N3)-methyltransferase